MKMILRCKCLLSITICIVIVAASVSGCSSPDRNGDSLEPHRFSFFAMDTAMTVTAYWDDNSLNDASDIPGGVKKIVETLDAKLSVTNEKSMIYAINHSDGEPVTVDSETASLIGSAVDICEKTGGCLDISVYPLVRAWGFTTGVYRLPEQAEILELLKNVNYRKIKILPIDGPLSETASSGSFESPDNPNTNTNTNTNTITVEKNMMLDLGAVAKGYAAEQIAGFLTDNGIESALISLGGNIKTIGHKPDGSDWNIAIASPYNDGYSGTLKISGRSVVTSGGYERYFEENGRHYCHIIDPSTGCPSDNGILSVTIIAEDSFLCDALSTALFVMGREAASEYWRSNPEYDFIIITDENDILISEGISRSFTPDDEFMSNNSCSLQIISPQ